MENKDKKQQDNDPGREGSNNSATQQNGNVGQQKEGSQQEGRKTGANRDKDTDPKGEDEHS